MNLKPIEIKTETSDFDFDKIYKETFIDPSKEIGHPPIAMGIGYHYYKGQQFLNTTFTYGEMSGIIAPKKTKKTYLKSALIASYIGGKSTNYFPSFVSLRTDNKRVYDFDTEQGQYYAQKVRLRINEMVGDNYQHLYAFGLKKVNKAHRVKFIDEIVEKYKGEIGWLSIDGIADLCKNPNDINEANSIIELLMKWNSYGIHINGVIHKTFDKEKGTGHLGTIYQNKCETTIFLKSTDKNDKNAPIEVTQEDSRGVPFDKFYFEIDNDNALPKECENPF